MAEQLPRRPRSLRDDALNLPNLITMFRIVMIPVVLWLMADGTRESCFWASMVYLLTAGSDFLDGWLARRMGLISILGKFLDPLADKLLVTSALIFMSYLGTLDFYGVLAAIIMIARELGVTALRTIALSEGVVMAAGQGGKHQTALQMVAILLLILRHPYEVDFGFAVYQVDLAAVGQAMLYLSLFFALTSAGEYIALFVEAVNAKQRRLAEAESAPER